MRDCQKRRHGPDRVLGPATSASSHYAWSTSAHPVTKGNTYENSHPAYRCRAPGTGPDRGRPDTERHIVRARRRLPLLLGKELLHRLEVLGHAVRPRVRL